MKTYFNEYLIEQTEKSERDNLCWLKAVTFGYGRILINIARKAGLPGKLPEEKIPALGFKRDVNNSILTFDSYLRKEPKENPNLWKVLFKTCKKEILFFHFLFFMSFNCRIILAYLSERIIRAIRLDESVLI